VAAIDKAVEKAGTTHARTTRSASKPAASGVVRASATVQSKIDKMLAQHEAVHNVFAQIAVTEWKPAKTGNGFIASIVFKGMGQRATIMTWRKTMDMTPSLIPGTRVDKETNEKKQYNGLTGFIDGVTGKGYFAIQSDAWALALRITAIL